MLCIICGVETNKCCSKCKKIYYCGTSCSGKDWEFHKNVCSVTSKEKFSDYAGQIIMNIFADQEKHHDLISSKRAEPNMMCIIKCDHVQFKRFEIGEIQYMKHDPRHNPWIFMFQVFNGKYSVGYTIQFDHATFDKIDSDIIDFELTVDDRILSVTDKSFLWEYKDLDKPNKFRVVENDKDGKRRIFIKNNKNTVAVLI